MLSREANASQQARDFLGLGVSKVAVSAATVVVVVGGPRSDLAAGGAPGGIQDQTTAPAVSEDTTTATTTTERSTPSPSEASNSSSSIPKSDPMRPLGGCDPAPAGSLSPCTKRSTSSGLHVTRPVKKKAKRSCPERKKAPDAPRRPLSAYNIFFLVERERLLNDPDREDFTYHESLVKEAVKANLKDAKMKKKRSHRKSHGKIAFKDLATAVSERWKDLSPGTKALFEKYATNERNKYKQMMEIWQKQRKKEGAGGSDAETAPTVVASKKPASSPQPNVVSPSGEETSKPLKIVDSTSPYVPSFASRDDSLTAMIRRGHAYKSLLNQKQAELEIRNSMLDHMQMMMSFPIEAVSPEQYESYDHRQYGLPPIPPSTLDVTAYAPHSEYNEPLDYYDAADATFQLAHRTLPPPSAHCFSDSIKASYPAQPSHVTTFENDPFVDTFDASRGYIQAEAPHVAAGYELHPPPGYNDMQYSSVVDPNQNMYGTSCQSHLPFEQYVPPHEAFPNAMPAVRPLQSYEPIAYDLEDTSDEEEDDDDADNVNDDDSDVVDVDDESIMGVLNPSADPFSLACVFE